MFDEETICCLQSPGHTENGKLYGGRKVVG
jgi:hypothetical protein